MKKRTFSPNIAHPAGWFLKLAAGAKKGALLMIIACVNYVLTSVVMPYPQVLEVAQGPPGGHDEGVDAAPVEGHPGQAPDVALLRVPGHDELDLGLAGRLALGPRQHWHSGSHIM